jgi:polyketide synthase PksJ
LGNAGEVIYCASNHFLDALACQIYTSEESDTSKQTYTAAINWDAWQEVGGAVETIKRMINSQLKLTMRAEPVKHPLLQSRIQPGPDKTVYISRLTPSKYWPLDEHRVKGEATLPGTAYLEIARAAFENHQGYSHMEIRDLYLISPLMVRDNEEKEVQTIFEKQGEEFEFRIISRESSLEDEWKEHVRGKITGTGPPEPRRYRIEALERMCPVNVKDEVLSDQDKLASDKEPISFGPRWIDSMRKIKYGDNGQLIEIELSEAFFPDIEVYKLHPALLDCALAVRQNDGFHIPFFYKKIRIHGSLPAKVFSYITYSDNHKVGSKTQNYNVTIMDEQGMERLMIEKYTLMKVSETMNIDASSEAADASGTDSLESTLLKKQLQNGILSAEGVEVFKRILEGTLPRYVVSTQELKYRLHKGKKSDSPGITEMLEETKESTPTHSRPELSTKYAAPSSETEKALAEVWGKFLGIDRVGINDNFFELGATSLTIVQISSLLKDKLGKDISIINMYTYPTINQLAQFLDQGKTPGMIQAAKASITEKRNNVLNRRRANIKGEKYAGPNGE